MASAWWVLKGLATLLWIDILASTAAELTWENGVRAPARWQAAQKVSHRFRTNILSDMEETEEDTVKEPEENDASDIEDIWKTVELSTERTAVIRPGVVADHNRALRIARERGGDGIDQSIYLMALFAELVEIDGQSFSRDEVEELPLQEYFPIQSALDDLANPPT